MIRLEKCETRYVRNKRCGNNQVVKAAIETFLMHTGHARFRMFTGNHVFVVGNKVVEIPLRNKTNGQTDQQ